MIRNICLLLKYSLKSSKTKSKIQLPPVIMYLIFAGVMLLISSGYAAAVGDAYGILEKTGNQELLLATILILGSVIVFVMGIFTVLNNFFLAEDTEVYMPLPFKASEIVLSKLITVLVYLYVYSLIIVLPLVSYGMAANSGIVYYVFVALAYIFNPIVPVVVAFIISNILMSVSNLSKHKDGVKLVFSIIMIAFIVAINVLFKGNNMGQKTAESLEKKGTLIKIVSGIFYNDKLEMNALANSTHLSAIISMAIVFVIIVILIAILYVVSEKMYLKTLKGFGDVSNKNGKVKVTKIKESSEMKALVMRDLKFIIRTPAFFLNCIVMLFYIPILYGLIIFSSALESSAWNLGYVVVGASMLVISVGMSSSATGSTALSREGKNFIVSKYIPVSYKTQIKSKIISTCIINYLIVVLGIVLLLVEKVRPEIFILSVIIQILTCFLISVAGIAMDYISPKLEWENEKRLFKGNFKGFTNIIIGILLGGSLLAVALLTQSIVITFIVNLIFLVIAIVVAMVILNKKALETYKKM